MLLKRGMGNGEWGMGNGEWGLGNGEWGMGIGEWGMGNGMIPGNGKLKWEFEKKMKKIYFFKIENKENNLKNEIENK